MKLAVLIKKALCLCLVFEWVFCEASTQRQSQKSSQKQFSDGVDTVSAQKKMGIKSVLKVEKIGAFLTKAERLNFVRRMKKEPAVRAFLDMISYAEGSFKNRPYEHALRGYLLRYPNISFSSFREHPHKVICAPSLGREICSSAAGRYMFLYPTWLRVSQNLGLSDFSPGNQDDGATFLLWENDALEDLLQGRIERAIFKVRKVWSSLPGSQNKQPTVPLSKVKKVFNERLKYYTNGGRL